MSDTAGSNRWVWLLRQKSSGSLRGYIIQDSVAVAETGTEPIWIAVLPGPGQVPSVERRGQLPATGRPMSQR